MGTRHAGTRYAAMVLAVTAACSAVSCRRYWVCDATDDDRTTQLPRHLSETGLYADLQAGTLAAGVVAFQPQFALWSDGAEKRRWIALPPGTRIDTSDPDDWIFPTGTRLWKEFRRDGVRVETRLLTRTGPGEDDWIGLAYLWDDGEHDATAAPWGATNARGTPHDVPASGECMACHGGRRSRVLGFSAIQLAKRPTGDADLEAIDHAPALTVPGDATERAALGYLHANCSHCHNPRRPARGGPRCFDPEKSIDFRLLVDHLGSAADTPARRTGPGAAFEPRDPSGSKLITRISTRGLFAQMPPVATERVDDEAVVLLRAWIAGLP